MEQAEIDKMFEGRWRIKGNGDEETKRLCRDFFEAGFCLSSPTESRTDLQYRSGKFRSQIFTAEFSAIYPNELLEDFYNYWSEPNRSNTKMRYELQKTWDVKRRLATWAKNDFNHYGKPTPNTQQQQLNKLKSILSD